MGGPGGGGETPLKSPLIVPMVLLIWLMPANEPSVPPPHPMRAVVLAHSDSVV